MLNEIVRDQIVVGTTLPKLREKLLRDKGLMVVKVVAFCKGAVTSAQNQNIMCRNRRRLLAMSELFEDTSHEKDYEEVQVPASAESPTPASSTVVPSCLQQPLQPIMLQRRSQRQTRRPERLGYDQSFPQLSQ
ncbi:hypothetical protein MRX96_007258 [Rhipicephalus microplus]